MRNRLARRTACGCSWISGFSLLENMIALAILSIGLLGSARLFGEALQAQHSNADHRAAVVLTQELINQLITAREDITGNASAMCMIAESICFDDPGVETWLAQWRARLDQRLPNAHASLSVSSSATTRSYRISITWTGRLERSESQRFEFVLRR